MGSSFPLFRQNNFFLRAPFCFVSSLTYRVREMLTVAVYKIHVKVVAKLKKLPTFQHSRPCIPSEVNDFTLTRIVLTFYEFVTNPEKAIGADPNIRCIIKQQVKRWKALWASSISITSHTFFLEEVQRSLVTTCST